MAFHTCIVLFASFQFVFCAIAGRWHRQEGFELLRTGAFGQGLDPHRRQRCVKLRRRKKGGRERRRDRVEPPLQIPSSSATSCYSLDTSHTQSALSSADKLWPRRTNQHTPRHALSIFLLNRFPAKFGNHPGDKHPAHTRTVSLRLKRQPPRVSLSFKRASAFEY